MSIKTSLMNLPFYNQMVLPWHYLQAVRYGVKYRWPARNLRVIGVTGTNGKTTTSFMIWKMLVEAGYKTGLLTTVGWLRITCANSAYDNGVGEYFGQADASSGRCRSRIYGDRGDFACFGAI